MRDHLIAQRIRLKPVKEIARRLGIAQRYIEPYGFDKAKLSLSILKDQRPRPSARYVVVTSINPTPFGEGKTVTTIGLSMALHRRGKRAIACLRQASLGPFFGVKGGATGGGYAQVIPRDDCNFHFTGDAHAVGIAHNLCAAFLENALYHGTISIDERSLAWRRVIDVSDRSLRTIMTGIGIRRHAMRHLSGFDITAASEVMAILALAEDMRDLRKRLGNIVLAFTPQGKPITAKHIKVDGAMAALLKDAIKPNLVQTLEHTPVLIHTGPFANIAHGNSSVIADQVASRYADFIVTESGFGADCGAEKFFNIKCRVSGMKPHAAVLVCSIRALKMHGGLEVTSPHAYRKASRKAHQQALERGSENLVKQIENIRIFGVPCVVAINAFASDRVHEFRFVEARARQAGAFASTISTVWSQGSRGAVRLATLVEEAARQRNNFSYLYPLTKTTKEKIETIARKVYGARNVSYSAQAEKKIRHYEKLGFGRLSICMAKTQFSLSHDKSLRGRPRHFTLPVRDVRIAAGAGFLLALCGNIRTMPGLPRVPRGTRVAVDRQGNIMAT